ncbi:hypothetical protein LCGC14_1600570 [marine sediment metagenome]|uniref:Uncharacterized protein n=1 Tax=marine sediment metagenome TaxID=412755 RepID=A0A0F9IB92_9ZZZZ
MTSKLILPLVSWGNGTLMIALFALVSVVLIGAVISMMSAGKKKKE